MNEEPMPACPWLASYEQGLCGLERKRREKRHSPLHLLIEKTENGERAGTHARGGRTPCGCTYEEARAENFSFESAKRRYNRHLKRLHEVLGVSQVG